MESNVVKLLNGLENLYPENTTISQIKRVLQAYPECEASLADAFSIGQIKSKSWLVEELLKLDISLGTVYLCAGWYATLAHMMFNSKLTIDKIRSFDIDSSCANIAETVNREQVIKDWRFKASTLDIQELGYDNFTYTTTRKDGSELSLTDSADTIINTSCEHITDFDKWYGNIPQGKIVILQTNNFVEVNEHVNCSLSLSGFAKITIMTNVLYAGELKLDKYTRFMRIGIK